MIIKNLLIIFLITFTIQNNQLENDCFLKQLNISSLDILNNYKSSLLKEITSLSVINFQKQTLTNFEILFEIKKPKKSIYLAIEFFKKNGKIHYEKFLQTSNFSEIKNFFNFQKKFKQKNCLKQKIKKKSIYKNEISQKDNFIKKVFQKNDKKRFLIENKKSPKHLKTHQHNIGKILCKIYGWDLKTFHEHTRRHYLKKKFKKKFKGYDKKRKIGYGFQHTY